jgi:hypothetical protein
VLAACEKPDASFTTSPSVKALIGTTTGNVIYDPPEAVPAPQDPPKDWAVDLSLASFQQLENGIPSLEVVLQVNARPGAGMELWLVADKDNHTVVRWSAGSSGVFEGTACFQLQIQDKTKNEAVPLDPSEGYHLTVVFRDVDTGVVVARDARVTASTPKLSGNPPAPGSTLMQQALACRRGQ